VSGEWQPSAEAQPYQRLPAMTMAVASPDRAPAPEPEIQGADGVPRTRWSGLPDLAPRGPSSPDERVHDWRPV
jgi:hypothetical protein